MAYNLVNSAVVGFCTEIVQALARVSSRNNPETLYKKVGALDALLSPFNRTEEAVTNLVDPNDNTVASARIVYRQRGVSTDVETDRSALDCDYNERALKNCTFEIEDWAGTKGRGITAETFRQLCYGGSPMDRWVMDDIIADLNAVRVHINEALLTHLSTTCVGVNVNNLVSNVPSASAKSITLLDADGNPIVFGLSQIKQDMGKNQLMGPFFVIGEGNLELFSNQKEWGCCNDGGLDIGAAAQWMAQNMLFYADHSANSILGDNNFLVIAPGVAQVPTFNEYRGPSIQSYNGNYANMRFPDPILPGLEYDMKIKFDDCSDKWNYHIGVHYDFWCWCSDVFAATDELAGMTGVFLYNAVQSS